MQECFIKIIFTNSIINIKSFKMFKIEYVKSEYSDCSDCDEPILKDLVKIGIQSNVCFLKPWHKLPPNLFFLGCKIWRGNLQACNISILFLSLIITRCFLNGIMSIVS